MNRTEIRTRRAQVKDLRVGDRITEDETPEGPFYEVAGFPTKSRSKIAVLVDGDPEPFVIPSNRYAVVRVAE